MLKQEDVAVVWTSDAVAARRCVSPRPAGRAEGEAARSLPRNARPPVGAEEPKRWVPVNDSAYEAVRETAKVLNPDLYS
jgi:hypothetical protein